jgi:hypothetical protein
MTLLWERLTIQGCRFVGDPPTPHKSWSDFFSYVMVTGKLEGIEIKALNAEA